MYSIQPNPPFSFSYSRARTLDQCPRAYYHRYYGSHNGWPSGGGSEAAQLTYRLKQLTTFHLVCGEAIHECAQRCVESIRDRQAIPTHRAMLRDVLAALRAVCITSKDADGWVQNPKRHRMLMSMYYDGMWDLSECEAVKTKVERCLASLVRCSVWDELRWVDPDDIRVIDSLDSIEIAGVQVYAAPDLVICHGGIITVLDWKTGAEVDEESAETQLAIYAICAAKRFGWKFDDYVWRGRVVSLHDGRDIHIELTRLHLMRGYHYLRERIEEMRSYTTDFAANAPRPVSDFPMVEPAFRFQCAGCAFRELCAVGSSQLHANHAPHHPRRTAECSAVVS